MPFNSQREVTDLERFDSALRDEKAFIASTEIQNVASGGGTLALTLENPSGTGVTCVVQGTRVTTAFKASVRLLDGFDVAPSGGSDAGTDNLLLDSGGGTDPGQANARVNDTYTGNNVQDAAVIGAGQGGQASGGTTGGAKFYMEPGREAVTEITNDTQNAGDAVVEFIWFELDEVLVGT